MASSSTTSEAARSTGPVVEKSGRNRSRAGPTCCRICAENSAKTSGQGFSGEPFTKSSRRTSSGQPPRVPDEPGPQLLGVGVDVVGHALADHQPDHVGREAQGAVVHEGLVDGGDERVERDPATRRPW